MDFLFEDAERQTREFWSKWLTNFKVEPTPENFLKAVKESGLSYAQQDAAQFGMLLNQLSVENSSTDEFKELFRLYKEKAYSRTPDKHKPEAILSVLFEIRRWIDSPHISNIVVPGSELPIIKLFIDEFGEEAVKLYEKDTSNMLSFFLCLRIKAALTRSEKISDIHDKELTAKADKFLADLRNIINDKNPDTKGNTPASFSYALLAQACCYYLSRVKDTFSAFKPMLLLLRACKKAAVTSELKHWVEEKWDEKPDENYFWISKIIAELEIEVFALESHTDKGLIKFRSQFASFCLSRLKTRKGIDKKNNFTNEDFIEPDPGWRCAYIRALRNLRINPEGEGHHILNFSCKNDPSKEVREYAETAYKELRHRKPSDKEESPVSDVIGAVWWLKRQNFISDKGIKAFDEKGSQKTYRKEVSRVKEKDIDLI